MNWLQRLFCFHEEEVLRIEGKKLFVSCVRCGKPSKGVFTGGFQYGHPLVKNRAQAVAKSFRPRRAKR